MRGMIGKKIEMTQQYGADGSVIPVTFLRAGPCVAVQIKTVEKDGYSAVQLGFGEKKRIKKPLSGHMKGAYAGKKGRGFLVLREIRVDSTDGVSCGDSVDIATFSKGEKVDVTGLSKGRGFAGVVKRHHFHGHPTTHGHKDQERMPGAIGSGGIQRVFKGLRMAGRMGNERVTVKNLEIINVDKEKGVVCIKGAVPGARNSILLIQAHGGMKWKKLSGKQEHDFVTDQAEKPVEHEAEKEV